MVNVFLLLGMVTLLGSPDGQALASHVELVSQMPCHSCVPTSLSASSPSSELLYVDPANAFSISLFVNHSRGLSLKLVRHDSGLIWHYPLVKNKTSSENGGEAFSGFKLDACVLSFTRGERRVVTLVPDAFCSRAFLKT